MASEERRLEIAAALARVVESAFPGDEALARAVRDWVAYPTAPPPCCAVCGRSLHAALAVEPGGDRLRLLHGHKAGARAVCGVCLDAARDTFAALTPSSVPGWKVPEGAPSWDMVLAQLERTLALLPEEDASVARDCLAGRPHVPVEGLCVLCKKKDRPTVRGREGGVCEPCARDARFLLHDLAAREAVEREDARCPQCGSRDVASGAVHIEFTEMTCLSCGHDEICDVWQLSDWYG